MMRWALLALAALCAAPATARQAPASDRRIAAALEAGGFEGFAMVASGAAVLWQTPSACAAPPPTVPVPCKALRPDKLRWPWASVSKQVLAILTMQQADAGKLALDTRADAYLRGLKGAMPAPTIRELLQHRSGLRNSNDSAPDKNGNPSFYSTGPTGLPWCLADRKAPGGDWKYNNCDSIVLGAVLERVTGQALPKLFEDKLAKPLALDATGYVGQSAAGFPAFARPLPPGYETSFKRYGAAGGLAGTGADLLAIDRALMGGKLMSPAARDAMWAGDPKLGFMALAQWVFDAPLKGCAKPVRIVERRGAIGQYQVRNIILPELDRIIVLFTDQEALEFGEIWQGKGLSHDLLAAAACP